MNAKKEYKFENHWQQESTESFTSEVISFWESQGVKLTLGEAENRISQIVIVIRNLKSEVVGISTAQESFISSLNNKFYGIRCILAEDARIPGLMSKLFVETIDLLEERFDKGDQNAPIGVISIVENERLKKYRREAVWPASKMLFVGKTKLGHHIRLRYFKGARV